MFKLRRKHTTDTDKPTVTVREVESLKLQLESDAGDRVAIVKGVNFEFEKLLNKVANGADITIKDIDKLLYKIRL